ncbi:hypothetical protein N7491_008233 [Penicillium cf. griseofulvum]|uniref:Uncharacterized protein n=1 Tax=Penicillium cf. griseofulvum TaxID=2972120 RepID=A0A9W9J4Q4_9EURO|nr:hypothetical protein N7472_008736 [Penicillium cf. griseofulvum]KAJ5427791.1 hypothetical protein N7491_008233 [Penicillium cf. griseofulvum]
MGRPHTRLLLLQPKRRFTTGNVLTQQSVLSVYPAKTKLLPRDPSPSELLRFVLTDSTTPIHDSNANEVLSGYLRKLFVHQWKFNTPPPPLWTSLKGLTSQNQKLSGDANSEIADVSSLRSFIERYVNDRYGAELLQDRNCLPLNLTLKSCQQSNTLAEILSMLSDLLARLKRLQLPIQPEMYSIALYFASSDLSASYLKHFLDGRHHMGFPALSLVDSLRIVQHCSEALDCEAFENPYHDLNPILSVITGEGELVPQNHNLHDILFWTQPADQIGERFDFKAEAYMCLLARLGSDKVLHRCWSHFLKNIQPKNHQSCIAAYQVVLALIQNVRSETAVRWLEDISQHCGDNLPFIATFPNLRFLLSDPIVGEALPDLVRGEDYVGLLKVCLDDMDRRMGVQWSPESQSHFSTALDPSESIWEAFEDQPLPTLDNKSISFDHGGQLYTELCAHGCSKSPAALSRIADLLNDHDGQPQIVTCLDDNPAQVVELRSESELLEFRWVPSHSPIEFSNSQIPALRDSSGPMTPSTLGLIQARLIVHGVPQMGIHSLHLMQVGCMDMRYGPNEPWQPSGYIVVWDRHFGRLLGLYVGQNNGVIDCGPAPSNGPLGALIHLTISTTPEEQPFYPSGIRPDSQNCRGPYYLDVDPGADLEY